MLPKHVVEAIMKSYEARHIEDTKTIERLEQELEAEKKKFNSMFRLVSEQLMPDNTETLSISDKYGEIWGIKKMNMDKLVNGVWSLVISLKNGVNELLSYEAHNLKLDLKLLDDKEIRELKETLFELNEFMSDKYINWESCQNEIYKVLESLLK